MARFSNQMISENMQVFWAALQAGEFIADAAPRAGTYRKQGTRWVIANGGVRPRRGRDLQGRYLSFAEREEIGLAQRPASRCARSRSGWAVAHRRSVASCPATSRCWAVIGPRPRMPRPGIGGAAETGEAGHPPAAARNRGAGSGEEVLAGADRWPVARGIPGRPGDVGVARDDLPVAVCAVAWRAAPRAHEVSAHWPGAAASGPSTRAAQEPDPGHGQHLRAASQGRRPCRARALRRAI
jgi:hypothetical protein